MTIESFAAVHTARDLIFASAMMLRSMKPKVYYVKSVPVPHHSDPNEKIYGAIEACLDRARDILFAEADKLAAEIKESVADE